MCRFCSCLKKKKTYISVLQCSIIHFCIHLFQNLSQLGTVLKKGRFFLIPTHRENGDPCLGSASWQWGTADEDEIQKG